MQEAPSPHISREPGSGVPAFDPQPKVLLESATDSIRSESEFGRIRTCGGCSQRESIAWHVSPRFAAFDDLDEVNWTSAVFLRAVQFAFEEVIPEEDNIQLWKQWPRKCWLSLNDLHVITPNTN